MWDLWPLFGFLSRFEHGLRFHDHHLGSRFFALEIEIGNDQYFNYDLFLECKGMERLIKQELKRFITFVGIANLYVEDVVYIQTINIFKYSYKKFSSRIDHMTISFQLPMGSS